jgi:hypothetical protein
MSAESLAPGGTGIDYSGKGKEGEEEKRRQKRNGTQREKEATITRLQ